MIFITYLNCVILLFFTLLPLIFKIYIKYDYFNIFFELVLLIACTTGHLLAAFLFTYRLTLSLFSQTANSLHYSKDTLSTPCKYKIKAIRKIIYLYHLPQLQGWYFMCSINSFPNMYTCYQVYTLNYWFNFFLHLIIFLFR